MFGGRCVVLLPHFDPVTMFVFCDVIVLLLLLLLLLLLRFFFFFFVKC